MINVKRLKVVLNCPAKINLYLEILGKLPNGYHEIDTLMLMIDLCDMLEVSVDSSRKSNFYCDRELGCNLDDTTIYRACEVFFEYTKIPNPGVEVNLKKIIPFESGLGGASSDAAGVLRGLNKIFLTDLSRRDFLNMGKEIGCDVPFFFSDSVIARCGGVGEILNEVDIPNYFKDLRFIVIKPSFSVSTKTAYQNIDKQNFKSKVGFHIKLCSQSPSYLFENMFNRFDEVLPENSAEKDYINITKRFLLEHGAKASCMTGSGSAVFGVFDDKNLADECLKAVKNSTDFAYSHISLNKIFDKRWIISENL